MKWKILIALIILVLSFAIVFSNATIYFSDDGGGTNDTNFKNSQTAFACNAVQQEVSVEFQVSTKCVERQCIYTVEHHKEIEKETHLKSSATCLSPRLKEFWL
ncbi:MAG: hypothetical protein M1542_02430 [Thermotogae bacterium]|jgi:hypothetical protein|nr:hypothetical protein [Thermotogota bacterium]MCL5032093.1 hypothetical protein [Thermotogota bacterium]